MLGKFDFMPLKKVFHGLKPKVSYRETKVSALGNCSFNGMETMVSSLETNSFRLGNNLFEGRRLKFRPFELTKKLSFTVSFSRSLPYSASYIDRNRW